MEKEAAHGAAGINTVRQRAKVGTAFVQLRYQSDQVLDAAAQPVQFPYNEGVTAFNML